MYNVYMRDNNTNIFYILLFFIITHNIAFANHLHIVKVNKDTTKIDLFSSIEILEDKDNYLTIKDVSKEKYTHAFKPASIIGNSFGISKSSFWVRFSIKIDKGIDESLYLELAYPLIDHVTLYIPNDNGEFKEKKSGELISSSFKDINYRNPLFHIQKNSNVQTYYMHVKSAGSTQIPLFLFTSSTLLEHIDKTNFILGGYYGNMVLLMIAALIAFLKLRDTIFLTYSIYLLSYLSFQLSINGFFIQYFSPLPLEYANYTTALSLAFVVIGGILFSGSFLKIWGGQHPKIRLLFYALILGAVMGHLITFTLNYTIGLQISTICGLLLPPTVLFAAIYSLYTGYQPARYFLVAWSVFLLGIFIAGLLYLGFIPHTFLTAYSMQIGSTFELLLLGYALIESINLLYKEKEQAIKKSNAYLNQINEGLESLVSQRTKELEERNVLLHDLTIRDSMTGMLNHNASLEQLSSMKSTALRYGYNLAVIMIDIDLFKRINDKYGHIAGDQVIIKIVEVINDNIRQSDFAGRYGGEEFIVMVHNADENSTMKLAERMRKSIETLKIPEINDQEISASFGISMFNASTPNADLILQADKALYEAKRSGRNQVCL